MENLFKFTQEKSNVQALSDQTIPNLKDIKCSAVFYPGVRGE